MSADGLEIVRKMRGAVMSLPAGPYEMHSAGGRDSYGDVVGPVETWITNNASSDPIFFESQEYSVGHGSCTAIYFLQTNAAEIQRLLTIGALAVRNYEKHFTVDAIVDQADALVSSWPTIVDAVEPAATP